MANIKMMEILFSEWFLKYIILTEDFIFWESENKVFLAGYQDAFRGSLRKSVSPETFSPYVNRTIEWYKRVPSILESI